MDIKFRRYLPFVITAFLYSTMEVSSKPISGIVNPEIITGIRFFLGGLIVFPFIKRYKFTFKTHLIFALIGVLNIFIAMNSLQIAIKYIPAGLAASLLSSNALFVYILSHFIEKEELRIREIATIVFSIVGIILISNAFYINIKGVLWALFASFVFAIYTIISRRLSIDYSIGSMTAFSFLYGGMFTLVFSLFKYGIFFINTLENVKILGILLYLGIFVTGLGYIFFFMTIKENSSRMGSYIFLLKPIFAVLWGFLFLKEKFLLTQYIGIIILVVSLYFLLKFRSMRT